MVGSLLLGQEGDEERPEGHGMDTDGLVREDLDRGRDLDAAVYVRGLLLARRGRLVRLLILRSLLCEDWG